MRIKHMVFALAILMGGQAMANTLELVTGQKIEGTFVGRSENRVQFEINGVVATYEAKDVKNVAFSASAAAPKQTPAPPAPAPAAKPAVVSVPAGTLLMVRTKEALDSSRHRAGHRFTASLEEDLVVSGTKVAPRGSNVYGQLSQDKQAGRLAGKSELTLVFTGLMIQNQIRPIRSGEVKAVTESGSGRDTLGKVARGAVIGGLIDGSDGARTGAKVGLGVAVLTRGDTLNIPAGTLLQVPLAEQFKP